MKKIQIQILASLCENNCNVSGAILGVCSYAEYIDFFKDPDFKSGVIEAEKIRDDFVLGKCMELVEQGDRQAISDYQKMMKQSDDANDAKRIRKEFMRLSIELADSKSRCLKEYCQVFNSSKNQAEKQYDSVVAEYNLETPYERSKKKKEKHSNSMSVKFQQNDLEYLQMYKGMMEIALYDAENSEYPSERKGAMDKVIDIHKRVDEITEQKRREEETDKTKLIDKTDAQLAGCAPEEIAKLREGYREDSKRIEAC